MPAEIRPHNGTPTLFLNGQPIFAGLQRLGDPNPYYAEAGIHLVSLNAGSYWQPPARPGGPVRYDFSPVAEEFQRVLQIDPAAYFHVRIPLDMPGWWQRLHPEECELASDGRRRQQSFASSLWRAEFQAYLRAYVAHLRDIGLADRVFAYQPGGGITTEWVNAIAMAGLSGDYSEPMRRHFRAWLRRAYHDDEAALRAAWADPSASFDTAEVPPRDEQLRITPPTFRDPRREQRAIDYFRCWADLCADLAIDACRAIKEATQGRALAGVFFGKLLELAWNAAFFGDGTESEYSSYQRSGHLALARILRSPYVDFVSSSYTYSFRGVGGEGAPMLPTASVRLHGKMHLYDDDTRTHISHHAGQDYGRCQTLAESVAVLRRNFAQALTQGLAITWISGSATHPHVEPTVEPGFRALLRDFQRLGTFALETDRHLSAEVAVLIDEESFFYETVTNDLDIPLILQQRLLGLPRMGAPFDTYLLQDFIEGRLPPYKLYIFLNPFYLDRTRREALKKELRRDGRVALWIYAPGYIQEEPSLTNMADLTGFSFGKGDHPWGPLMHITNFNHPITQGLPQDLFWGTNSRLGPLFHLEPYGATVLGNVVYSQGRCRPGFGVRVFPEWTSIYVAAPNVPAPVLRGIARYAGVHIYSEAGDVLYATPQLLGVHTLAGGERVFKLPRPVEVVYELFDGEEVAANTAEFRVTLAPASTVLYYTGPAEKLKRL